jgi:hypothetical protein
MLETQPFSEPTEKKEFSFADFGSKLDALLARVLKRKKSKTHSEEISVVDHDQVQIKDTNLDEAAIPVPEVAEKTTFENISDQKINAVVKRLEGGVDGVAQSQITAAMEVLQKLDVVLAQENEELMKQSPFKKIGEVAEKMNSANRDSFMSYIDRIKEDFYAKLEDSSKRSKITADPLTIDEVLSKKLDSEIFPYETLSTNGGIAFESADALDDFLIQTVGVDLKIIKENKEIWKNGNGSLISKIAPGLKISIYDRTEMGQSTEKFAVDTWVSITAGENVDMFKAAMKAIVEEKKSKETAKSEE